MLLLILACLVVLFYLFSKFFYFKGDVGGWLYIRQGGDNYVREVEKGGFPIGLKKWKDKYYFFPMAGLFRARLDYFTTVLVFYELSKKDILGFGAFTLGKLRESGFNLNHALSEETRELLYHLDEPGEEGVKEEIVNELKEWLKEYSIIVTNIEFYP